MIPSSISTFNSVEIGDNDENAIPSDEMKSSTSDAVKESQIQVSFAEQTASEMRQILSDWNATASPERKQRPRMRRNSLMLMDVAKERPKRRSLSIPSPIKGKVDPPSPTNTIETEMMDSQSEGSDGSHLSESLRVNDSFVCDEDDLPQISFLPSSDVLQQSTEVESIMRNAERQSSELDRTFHATKYDAVMIELQHSHALFGKKYTESSSQMPEAPHDQHFQERESSPMTHMKVTDPTVQTIDVKKKSQGRSRQIFAYVLLPIAFSVLFAKVFVEYGEAEQEIQ